MSTVIPVEAIRLLDAYEAAGPEGRERLGNIRKPATYDRRRPGFEKTGLWSAAPVWRGYDPDGVVLHAVLRRSYKIVSGRTVRGRELQSRHMTDTQSRADLELLATITAVLLGNSIPERTWRNFTLGWRRAGLDGLPTRQKQAA
jgi:hypothetical protein